MSYSTTVTQEEQAENRGATSMFIGNPEHCILRKEDLLKFLFICSVVVVDKIEALLCAK